MRSAGLIEAPDLIRLEITPTPEEQEKIDQNYLYSIKDGKLQFTEPPWVKEPKKQQTIETLKQNIKTAQTLEDVKNIVQTLLDNS